MKKILVAVDGSAHSNKAIDIASTLAKEDNASVIVVHTVSNKNVTAEIRQGLEVEYAHEIEQRFRSQSFTQPLPDENQYARAMLSHSDKIASVMSDVAGEMFVKTALGRLHDNGVGSVDSVLTSGDAADEILRIATERGVDTVVLGCRGTGKISGLLLGSVSQSVAHNAGCSVVIVK